ncbi:phenylacetate--CoA ligase family protein [Methylomonas sp. SURF-2]|uniref:Phenylacetate--CoA ligase family protein n=1 Tax=Methylomonas subterranea TaxID=2952225 RepID=A0ABT1TEX1_9GAMM|nr:phenylacetate--CoA ligase family protein [Methylomonas sp. SURF-2]MCQ8103803.1 phenylacetate--CoA ligase family protein [Methylomonas sp. SURF-2]
MPKQTIPNFDAAFARYGNASLDQLLDEQHAGDPQARVLALFKRCVEQVPAYRDFLATRKIDPAQITDFAAFQTLPMMNKADYMQSYPLPQRCLGGSLLGADRVAVSSGSTGQATFWPRSAAYELDVAVRFEQVFVDSFAAGGRSTLAVVCFALGNWVGGLFTTSCCWHLARKGYPLMVATPGNNKAEIFRVVRELAPHFEQTVLLGYPPFVKDVLDAGAAEGVAWAEYRTKLVFAGEVFSEEWRALLGRHTGSVQPCFDSASLYGTADGGVLGNETPLSIAIRRWLAKHPRAARELFGESRLPTLVQYDPRSRFFEVRDNTLVVSGENSVPLVRYHIADKGGVLNYAEMWDFLQQQGVDSLAELGLPADFAPRRLPFVFVFGRADFTVSYYGANIYPENVAVGLERDDIARRVTGKFVLQARETALGDKELHIAVELLPAVTPDPGLPETIALAVKTQLLRLNSEFAHYTPVERQLPRVSLHAFADPEYFPVGVKHRYTRKAEE